jgi:hypothetical protein
MVVLQEKVLCCFCYGTIKAVTIIRECYRSGFGNTTPFKNLIKEWHRKCTEHDCLYKRGGPNWPWRSGRNVEQVREAVSYSPVKSICRAGQQPQIPPVTVWQVLKKPLHMKLYRLQLV